MLEDISKLACMNSVENPQTWRNDEIKVTIQGLASLHSICWMKEQKLLEIPSINTALILETQWLWEALSTHAAQEFPEWYTPASIMVCEVWTWIVEDPEVLGGKPSIRGTRLSALLVARSIGYGMSFEDIKEAYGSISEDAVREAVLFAVKEAEKYDELVHRPKHA